MAKWEQHDEEPGSQQNFGIESSVGNASGF